MHYEFEIMGADYFKEGDVVMQNEKKKVKLALVGAKYTLINIHGC